MTRAGIFCFAILMIPLVAPAHAEPLRIDATPILLDPDAPTRTQIGALTFRAGFELTSPNSRFGGLSGLVFGVDGKTIIAITDKGDWLRFTPELDAAGTLIGIGDAEIFPMLAPGGRTLRAEEHADAEAVTRAADGSLLVTFEGHTRLRRFAGDDPFSAMGTYHYLPATLAQNHGNKGLETLQTLPDGRQILIMEGAEIGKASRGWVVGEASDISFTYPNDGYFRPTDAALLDARTLLVLERGYTFFAGAAVRVMQVPIADILPYTRLRPRELAQWRKPLTVDNFEGLAVTRSPQGVPLLYLLSDDNFSMLQRTLLLQFALENGSTAG